MAIFPEGVEGAEKMRLGSIPLRPGFDAAATMRTEEQQSMAVPLTGKTYSLRGPFPASDDYYTKISQVTELCLGQTSDAESLLAVVRTMSTKKRFLRKLAAAPEESNVTSFLVHTLRAHLRPYTTDVASHLKSLSLSQVWDRTIGMTEEQYHCAMVEIELVNRLHTSSFRRAETKLAFLPHCLHDLTADCRSVKRGADYVCKGCSKVCTINAVSKMLRRHGVIPYIWMTASLRSFFRKSKEDGKSLGVLGIACIPELMNGMRACSRAKIPVVGIPLDANRCRRWCGEFHPTGTNLSELEKLLGDETLVKPRATASREIRIRQEYF